MNRANILPVFVGLIAVCHAAPTNTQSSININKEQVPVAESSHHNSISSADLNNVDKLATLREQVKAAKENSDSNPEPSHAPELKPRNKRQSVRVMPMPEEPSNNVQSIDDLGLSDNQWMGLRDLVHAWEDKKEQEALEQQEEQPVIVLMDEDDLPGPGNEDIIGYELVPVAVEDDDGDQELAAPEMVQEDYDDAPEMDEQIVMVPVVIDDGQDEEEAQLEQVLQEQEIEAALQDELQQEVIEEELAENMVQEQQLKQRINELADLLVNRYAV